MKINPRHSDSLQIADRLIAPPDNAVVEQHDLTLRRDEDCAIALPHVHVVDLELAVGLRSCKGWQAYEGERHRYG
jgi:hypothetical protein